MTRWGNICKKCGSMAINPHRYGRDPNEDLDLCDVCYWRKRAEVYQWHPIETAPKDGTRILFYRSGGIVVGSWDNDEYANSPRPYFRHDRERLFGIKDARNTSPTHWMPLPDPPKEQP